MKFKYPYCPTCGHPASGTVESLQGEAEMTFDDDTEEHEYGGYTDIWWDGQKSDSTEEGHHILYCQKCCATWQSALKGGSSCD